MSSGVAAPSSERWIATLGFLSAASKALAVGFDYGAALERVAALAIPSFADGLRVELDEDGTSVVVLDIPAPRSDRKTERSFPLAARDRTLGTLCVAFDGDLHVADEIDDIVFGDIAVRIAVAIDAAQIYAREHKVADTLQRALLPDVLPGRPGIRFDGAYLPATKESIVGGDWYDAFPLPDGRIALSIGDVAGHGLPAAVIMGEVRQAFRAAALNPKSPSLVLERANTIVNMRANPHMVTAIFGILDPANGTITYAGAGHPGPLIALPDATVMLLPGGGLPLGIEDEIDTHDWTFTIPPGGYFTMYTDGLIEHSRHVIEGEAALIEAMRGQIHAPSTNPARALMERVFGSGRNSDDAAALIVCIGDDPSPAFECNFSAMPFAVSLARHSLERYALRLGVSEDKAYSLITAVGEAMANAVEHAYLAAPGIVHVKAHYRDGSIHITIEDQGRWKQAYKREERGRGLPLMRALMDSVAIETAHSRTCIQLTMHVGELAV